MTPTLIMDAIRSDDDVLGAPKDLVEVAQRVFLVGRLGLCAPLPLNARHVLVGEERFAVGVLACGKREKLLDERVVLDGLVGLQSRIQS